MKYQYLIYGNIGLESLKVMFLEKNTLYYIEIPFFVLGIVISTINTVKLIKKKEFNIDSVMVITFFALLISNLMVNIGTTNKCNVMYIPILYFVAVGIIEISKKSWIIGTFIIAVLIVFFINFEYQYYTNIAYYNKTIYDDIELQKITEIIENDDETKDLEKYVITKYHQQQYIFTVLENKTSPYEFNETKEMINLPVIVNNKKITVQRLIGYKNYHFPINKEELEKLDFENEKYVFVIEKNIIELVEFIESKNYEKQEYEYYYILKPEI